MLWLMVIILTLGLLFSFPFMVSLMAAPVVVAEVFFPKLKKIILIQQSIGGVEPVALLAVPMFIFAADIMTAGRSSRGLLNFVSSFVRHIHGGLPIVTVSACTLFGAVSGSTQATVSAVGVPLRRELIERGYSSSFSTGLIASAAGIALLIPPSISMIIFGVSSGASVGEMFIAGIGPGMVVWFLFVAYSYLYSRIKKVPAVAPCSWAERWTATRKAILPMGFPAIIIGGIYSGLFSPTESAAIAVAYALLLELVIYRSIKPKDIYAIALNTGIITCVVFILVGVGTAFSWIVSYGRLPQLIIPSLLGSSPTEMQLLIIISISFFIACMFVDSIVAIIILTPIFKAPIIALGIDPVLVGIIVTLQCAIGAISPPFGCNIFTAMAIFKRPYWESIKNLPVFLLLMLVANGLIIAFPSISLALRDIAFK